MTTQDRIKLIKVALSKLLFDSIEIRTLEGNHLCNIGDYIIKGVQGEFYPCKPDIFEETYEVVDDE